MLRMTFKARTIAVVWVTSTITALVACGAFLLYDRITYSDAVVKALHVYADSLASRSVTAMQFNDPTAALEILSDISVQPDLVASALFRPDGSRLAHWERSDNDGINLSSPWILEHTEVWHNDHLLHAKSVAFAGEELGTLVIASDLSALDRRLRSFGAITLLALSISLSIAALIATRLQRGLVQPVTALARTAIQIRSSGDYTARATKVNDDEVGALTDAFNAMLAEIQRNQAALREYSEHLQELVDERTRELAAAMEASKATAESLRASEQLFRSLSTNAPIGIFRADTRGNIIYANPMLLATSGLSEMPKDNAGWHDSVPPEDRARVAEAWKQMMTEGAALDYVRRIVTADGVRWAHVRAQPVDAGADGVVGTLEDITARRHAEQERARMVEEHLRLSREAGMAEIATSVLHNVGNVLNSVNVSATTIAARLEEPRLADILGIAQLLKAQGAELAAFFERDPRGPMLPEYLSTVADMLQADQNELATEMASVLTHVEHIKKVVAMQQSFARVATIEEPVHPSELIEEAVALGVTSLERHDVELVRALHADTEIQVDKHKVLQILINLISNAKHAVVDSTAQVRQVTVSTQIEGPMVVIKVTDTGVGISADNLRRVFAFGFTTKKNGHGFGLHSSANTAQQLGGELTAHSDGPGTGATFTLKLPLDQRDKRTGSLGLSPLVGQQHSDLQRTC